MYKIYKLDNIKRVVIHHSGGLYSDPYASTQNHTAEMINEAHRARWNFVSMLGKYGGYNSVIEMTGLETQYRMIGEETAAQKGYNKDTLSICVMGNFILNPNGFAIDKPTSSQTHRLSKSLFWIYNTLKIPIYNFIPHRLLAPTECYGNALSNSWARDRLKNEIEWINPREQWLSYFRRRIELLQAQIFDLIRQQEARRKGKPTFGELDYRNLTYLNDLYHGPDQRSSDNS